MKKQHMSNLVMLFILTLIFAYIFYEGYSVTHIKLQTETAELSTVYETIETKALVIRDEVQLQNAGSGVTVPGVADGDKVRVGGRVAMAFATPQAAENYSKYAQLQNQLQYYENLESQTFGQAASVESINTEIDTKVDAYIRALASGNTATLNRAGDSVNDALLRRQMIIGEKINLRSLMQQLRKESDALAAIAQPEKEINTEVAGVFSSYTDGFENAFDYEAVAEMNAEQIEQALADCAEKQTKETPFLGKLVTSYAWYFACVVEAQAVRDLSQGSKVQVALKDSDDTVLTVRIISGTDVQPGQEKTALIMQCSYMDSKLAALRCEDIEIRLKAYEGFKVPAYALHIDENGNKGVYALISGQSHFRHAEVIYSQDDFVMLKFDTEDENGIRLYDRIITQGKELDDGKVYA